MVFSNISIGFGWDKQNLALPKTDHQSGLYGNSPVFIVIDEACHQGEQMAVSSKYLSVFNIAGKNVLAFEKHFSALGHIGVRYHILQLVIYSPTPRIIRYRYGICFGFG